MTEREFELLVVVSKLAIAYDRTNPDVGMGPTPLTSVKNAIRTLPFRFEDMVINKAISVALRE